ncbi:glycoside hydrolase family 5 protein [Mycobacterium sp. NPDC004974]
MGTPLRGVNIAGAEVAYDPAVVPVEGENYIWMSLRDIDYLADNGVPFIRITFSWELAQPELNGELSLDGYFGVLLNRVRYATAKGLTVMIEPHGGTYPNFARYKGDPVGSAAVPADSFGGFWSKVETALSDCPTAVFGLSNEPNGMSTTGWFTAAAAAVEAVHGTNSERQIFICGNGFSQPASWQESWYDTDDTQVSNASAWSQHLAGADNVVASVHTYFDSGGDGSGDDVVNPDIIRQRLEPAVAWASASGVRLHLTEFGANQATPGAVQAVTNALEYLDAHDDVVIGWSWWTYGAPAWWAGYHFTLSPTQDYTVDNPKLAWLHPHFVAPAPQPTIRPWLSNATAPPDDRNPFIARVKVKPGMYAGIGEGTYSVRVRIRTTHSDADTFCVAVVLENPNDGVEIDWHHITIDLRGHTLIDWWDSDVVGTTGWVTASPSDQGRVIGAHNKTSFGLCLKRDDTPLRADEQIRVKDLQW